VERLSLFKAVPLLVVPFDSSGNDAISPTVAPLPRMSGTRITVVVAKPSAANPNELVVA
jgi:hypothetical protein